MKFLSSSTLSGLSTSILSVSSLSIFTACTATILLAAPLRAENLEQTQQLLNTRDCAKCELNKAGLVHANLSGANLSEANLIQANLSHADLSGANLSGARLTGAALYSVDLTGANLSGADLSGADLRDAILLNANLEGANLQDTMLLGAVGLPETVATAENHYRWGMQEAGRGNFRDAVYYYDQAISLKPDFAHAYMARSIARYRLADRSGAMVDAQEANRLYTAQNNSQGEQIASQFATGIQQADEAYADEQKRRVNGGSAGGNILNVIGGLAGMALQVLQYMAF
ncbi:MAG: pentapeptide repeat-containing protein [Pegethrix bostrychoides GSE-TBD4-15B]|jgi:uncharacterized protein YjbI with pentapeptide repeats|uniref:Pentapeptide repeat-containing protein n=1 Tax=Pegethrix bostrychoides GSE-TBD4-15B TaxID=2839662 RepID=A0A951U2U0_9CYAN|nr:pentapeptide repeat-containing protein [Pegethrix bostrychoides GSE-TBD4-15B]